MNVPFKISTPVHGNDSKSDVRFVKSSGSFEVGDITMVLQYRNLNGEWIDVPFIDQELFDKLSKNSLPLPVKTEKIWKDSNFRVYYFGRTRSKHNGVLTVVTYKSEEEPGIIYFGCALCEPGEQFIKREGINRAKEYLMKWKHGFEYPEGIEQVEISDKLIEVINNKVKYDITTHFIQTRAYRWLKDVCKRPLMHSDLAVRDEAFL